MSLFRYTANNSPQNHNMWVKYIKWKHCLNQPSYKLGNMQLILKQSPTGFCHPMIKRGPWEGKGGWFFSSRMYILLDISLNNGPIWKIQKLPCSWECPLLGHCPYRQGIWTFGPEPGLSHRNRDSWHVWIAWLLYSLNYDTVEQTDRNRKWCISLTSQGKRLIINSYFLAGQFGHEHTSLNYQDVN